MAHRLSDASVVVLLKFVSQFLLLLGKVTGCEMLNNLSHSVPKSLWSVRKLSQVNRDEFEQLVSCPKCSSIYRLPDCFVNNQPIVCSYVRFPKHPHASRRKPCSHSLLRQAVSNKGKAFFTPYQVFCYKSLVESIKYLITNDDKFFVLCNQWRSRNVSDGILADVYDGKVWQEFGEFLKSPNNLLLGFSVDWFQPYKSCQYSVGVMYLCIQNLPRHLRYLEKYIIVCGIIPGPKEPELTLNTYLDRLVSDLKSLWTGVTITTPSGTFCVRAALCLVSCDIPALRKCLGFMGIRAVKACSKCLKDFPTEAFGETPDYSGFGVELWPKRTATGYNKAMQDHKDANTKAKQKELERKSGVRCSSFCQLSYFDVIRFHVVDPMHNLLLWTSKMMVELWKSEGILNESNFNTIQKRCDNFKVPSDIGRIPYKISSSFSGFKADQWRTWTNVFSLCVLNGVLPQPLYRHWSLFVKACSLLCSRVISVAAVHHAHTLLIQFCEEFEHLYGKEKCTMNMHLHCHLRECLLDFGPVYSFWLYSFERENGILGSYPTNNRSIEVQLMRKHIQKWQLQWVRISELDSVMKEIERYSSPKGTLALQAFEDIIGDISQYTEVSRRILSVYDLYKCQNRFDFCTKTLSPLYQCVFSSTESETLKQLLISTFGDSFVKLFTCYQQFSVCSVRGVVFGAKNSRHHNSSFVIVHRNQLSPVPCQIQYFARLNILLQNAGQLPEKVTLVCACVSLYQSHPCSTQLPPPVEIYYNYFGCSVHFVFIEQILCKFAFTVDNVQFNHANERVLSVIPLNNVVVDV